jgi:pterin-4a-carbinolamine dehydratase
MKPHTDQHINESGSMPTPLSLYREFHHDNFVNGSRFLATIAAVAHNNNHYPEISLKRRLHKDANKWEVIVTICCHTPTLKGLSHHDFHLALMVDVETLKAIKDGRLPTQNERDTPRVHQVAVEPLTTGLDNK